MAQDLAMRFPSETPMEVFTPDNPPPGSAVWGGITGTITNQTDLIAYLASAYLKLDQTVEQSVINGSPHFQGGVTIKAGQKLIFDGV